MTGTDILKYFQGRQDAIIESIREIVEIESPSFNTGQSRAVADWVEKSLGEIPLKIDLERIPADGYGEHLIVRAFANGGPRTLLLGHTDTVHPTGTSLRNQTRIEEDRFYGCGIFDMKGNVPLMLEALRFFAVSGASPSCEVTILLSCDEEVGSFTGRPLVEREAASAEACLIFEPSSDGRVKTGRKGTSMYSLRALGVPAHAGLEPEKGVNAILELSRQIPVIHEIDNGEIGTTVNVTTIRGGTTSNVIPDNAECEIDVRFSRTSEATRVDTELRSLPPFDSRVTLELTGGINRPPMERTEPVVRLYEKARDLAASFGYLLGETQVGGASDGNFVSAMGVTVLDGLGIAGGGAHTLDEHILVSDIANRATLTTLLLMAE